MKVTLARKRAWKAGATAGFTLIASAVMMAGPSVTAAHATEPPFCEEVSVWTSATGTFTTFPQCVNYDTTPYTCVFPQLNFNPDGGTNDEVCAPG